MSLINVLLSGLGSAGTPSCTLNSPANAATGVSTTPQLQFTGVTSDGVQKIEYEVQIDTTNTFSSAGGFVDPLSGSSQNTTIWGGNYGTLSWSTNFTITNPINYTGYGGQLSNSSVDLTGKQAWANITNIGNQALTSLEVIPLQLQDAGATNLLFWYINQNNVQAITKVSGTQTTRSTAKFADMGSPTWFQIRESGGQIYWEYGNDGINWKVFFSMATPITITALFMQAIMGTFNLEASSTTAVWNQLALAPVPLIDKFSAVDTGFANITNALNTHPFPSGEQIGYTPASALTGGTTYYWRVRQVSVPGNVNYLPTWSSTFSFTTTGGGAVNASVTQLAANLVLTPGTQAVASTRIVNIAQVAGALVLTTGTQAVATVQNASVTQVSANLVLTPGTQAVASVQIASITQVSANLVLTGGTQVVSAGAIVNASITQVAANLTLTPGTQSVAAQISTNVVQTSANLVLTGGTQAVATVRNVAISQTTANLTLTGGTQTVASVRIVAISQLAANLVLTGGTQAVVAKINASVTQISANLVLTPGTQVVSAVQNVNIAQISANLVLTPGTQAVSAVTPVSASINQVSVSLVLTPGTQGVVSTANATVVQVTTNLVLTPGVQILTYEPPKPIIGESISILDVKDVITITQINDTVVITDISDVIRITDTKDAITIREGADGATVTSYSDVAIIQDTIDNIVIS